MALNLSTPTPYGKACITCARAKAKCVHQDGIGKCERCHRLNKACQPAPSVRSSGVQKKSSSKAARLEEKLDGLVTLLTAASKPHVGQAPTPGQLNASAALAQFGASPESLESRAASPGCEPRGISENTKSPNSDRQHVALSHEPNGHFLECRDFLKDSRARESRTYAPPYHISALFTDEANESFRLFKSQMLPYFPFMVLPGESPLSQTKTLPRVTIIQLLHSLSIDLCSYYHKTSIMERAELPHLTETTTPQQLRAESPFLWLCIMAFTTKSSERRKILGNEIRQTIGTKLIVEGHKSKDFLHGLLLYAGWGHYYVFTTPIMVHVMHLAIGLLGGLGLKKQVPKESACMMLNYDARGLPRPFLPEARSLDDRRLAISCWSISQFISSYFQKTDTMRWSSYYDECMHSLTENPHPADTFFVQLVKFQLLHERVVHAPCYDPHTPEPSANSVGASQTTPTAPASFYVKAFQNDLNQIRKDLPSDLRQDDVLALYGYDTELSIHEIALSKFLDPSFNRLESLWAALQAVTNWFDVFSRISPGMYVSVPMGILAQFAHVLVALSRLSSFEHPNWDLGLARATCDLSARLDEVIERFDRVKVEANLDCGPNDEPDVFSLNARRLTTIKSWWEGKVAAQQQQSMSKEPIAAAASDSSNMSAMADPMLSGFPPLDFSNDSWMKDILSLDDSQFNQFLLQ